MPEWVTPQLYWVVGTTDALSSFPAAAKPFADKLTAAKKAWHLLANLEQYVMLLDYGEYALAEPVGAEPPKLDPHLPRCSVLGLCPLPVAQPGEPPSSFLCLFTTSPQGQDAGAVLRASL